MMTVRQLRRMLKRTPGWGVVMILVMAAMIVMAFFAIKKMLADDESLIFKLILSAIFVFVQYVAAGYIIRVVKGAIKVRKNGEKTIAYLKSNGLLEIAVDEYNQPNRAALRVADRDLTMDKFPYRNNTLTENFIFALSSNQIVRYQDIERACLVRYVFADAGTYSNEVLTLLTHDGEEIDLLSYQLRAFVKPPRETLDWICAVIKSRNPKCEINTTIPLIRKR